MFCTNVCEDFEALGHVHDFFYNPKLFVLVIKHLNKIYNSSALL